VLITRDSHLPFFEPLRYPFSLAFFFNPLYLQDFPVRRMFFSRPSWKSGSFLRLEAPIFFLFLSSPAPAALSSSPGRHSLAVPPILALGLLIFIQCQFSPIDRHLFSSAQLLHRDF